jgi:ABC-type phosphate/phosphonate transport system ATPase subunit
MTHSRGFSVSVDALTVEFPGRERPALSNITLDIMPGEHVAILGASGCGKTTLLRSLLGVVPATGRLRVGGYDATAPSSHRTIRRQAGVMRQGSDLVPQLSGRVNALMGVTHEFKLGDWLALARGQVPARWEVRLAHLAREHGVSHCLDVPSSTLSGGERHRVALVRALLGQPRLVLADEPTTGLDPVAASGVVDELLGIQDATLLVTTHDLDVARRFPRKVGLQHGRLLFDVTSMTHEAIDRLYGTGIGR